VSPNHADYFTAVHSVLKLGGVLSPANPLYTPYEIANQLKDSGAELVMAHPMVRSTSWLVLSVKSRQVVVLKLISGGVELEVAVDAKIESDPLSPTSLKS
jgi:long-chain acyl-CoA synthetase